MSPHRIGSALAAALLWLAAGAVHAAGPTFPALTGRVVDAAGVLPAATEADLTAKLQALETQTGRQLVVATVPSLQDYPIEDYGYQLGRAWGIGQKGNNDGAVFLVAPADRQVRIEVGYGLEPVLTDALSSVILQQAVLPRFRAGDVPGGVVAGADAIIRQLALPDDEAKANVAAAVQQTRAQDDGGSFPISTIIFLVILFLVLSRVLGGRRGAGWLLPMILMGGRSGGGSFGGGGGGGFGGGGGSFGGGGASGRW